MNGLALAAGSGALIFVGAVIVVMGLRPAPVRLADAFARLDGSEPLRVVDLEALPPLQRWASRVPIPLLKGQEAALALAGRTREEHMADKVVHAMIAAMVPSVVGAAGILMDGSSPWLPAILAPLGAVVGWFIPDLALRRRAPHRQADAGEALFTYFDLVTLERLANRSATQSLSAAADVSDATLFRHLREALDRARLEQRPPWDELIHLAERLTLPALADIADVMRLDESGAPLSDVLRARVRELRDAHLTRAKIDAHATSERMTIWMVVPALILGLLFLAPRPCYGCSPEQTGETTKGDDMSRYLMIMVSLVLVPPVPARRDERGLSQSTENAILLGGAVMIAGIVIQAIRVYVKAKMPK